MAESQLNRHFDWKPLAILALVMLAVGWAVWSFVLPSGKAGKETAKAPAPTAAAPKTAAPQTAVPKPDAPKAAPATATDYVQQGVKEKDPQKKIDLYTKAIELEPKNALALNNRGYTYYTKKNFDQAIADLDRAIAAKPDYALAYNNRGDVYYDRKESDRALADYSQAIALEPK